LNVEYFLIEFGAVSICNSVIICSGYTLQAAVACPELDEGQAFHFNPGAHERKNITSIFNTVKYDKSNIKVMIR
jgi:hypothetical protein